MHKVFYFYYFQQLKNGMKSHRDTETSLDTDASGPDKDDLYLDLINPWREDFNINTLMKIFFLRQIKLKSFFSIS